MNVLQASLPDARCIAEAHSGFGRGLDPDALDLGVFGENLDTARTPVATHAETTEGRCDADRLVGIDPERPGSDLCRNAMCARDIARPDCASDAENAVI